MIALILLALLSVTGAGWAGSTNTVTTMINGRAVEVRDMQDHPPTPEEMAERQGLSYDQNWSSVTASPIQYTPERPSTAPATMGDLDSIVHQINDVLEQLQTPAVNSYNFKIAHLGPEWEGVPMQVIQKFVDQDAHDRYIGNVLMDMQKQIDELRARLDALPKWSIMPGRPIDQGISPLGDYNEPGRSWRPGDPMTPK